MELDALVVIGLIALALPMIGTVFAMLLGVVVTVRGQSSAVRHAADTPLRIGDALEHGLRLAAKRLGSWIENDRRTVTEPQQPNVELRTTHDRRARERRISPRRQRARLGPERRRHDRRLRDRRQELRAQRAN